MLDNFNCRKIECWHKEVITGKMFAFSIISMILASIFVCWFFLTFCAAIFSRRVENLARAKYALIVLIPMGMWLAASVCLYLCV